MEKNVGVFGDWSKRGAPLLSMIFLLKTIYTRINAILMLYPSSLGISDSFSCPLRLSQQTHLHVAHLALSMAVVLAVGVRTPWGVRGTTVQRGGGQIERPAHRTVVPGFIRRYGGMVR